MVAQFSAGSMCSEGEAMKNKRKVGGQAAAFSISLLLDWGVTQCNIKPHMGWLAEKEILEISLLSLSFIAFFGQLYWDVGDCLA